MPSFTRRAPATHVRPAPLGSVASLSATQPALHLLPTGIPSLDDLLAGGVPLGGIFGILAPDRHTAWSRLAARYWIAQGLATGQKSVVVGEGNEVRDVVGGCMWVDERSGPAADGSESEGEGAGLGQAGEGKGGTKIAWRYERMKKFQTTVKGSGRELNLMTPIPGDLLSHLEETGVQAYIPLDPPNRTGSSSKASPGWTALSGALRRIAEALEAHDEKTALRLTIHDLGSVDWASPSAPEIQRFVHSLRGLIMGKPVGVLITLPSELCRSPPTGAADLSGWTTALGWSLDALVELRGFGDDPTLPPLFHPLHGLLSLPSLPGTHHLLPPSYRHSALLGLAGSGGTGGAGENNLGFRLKRKRFVVETVHLGIEGGTGERRTEPKPELGSLVGAAKPEQGKSEGVERHPGQDREGAPAGSSQMDTGADMPKGPQEEKKRKPRARVRFGGEEELGPPEVSVEGQSAHERHGHEHDHDRAHAHAHAHAHSHAHPPPRPVVRHDRPDLYEF